MCVNYFSIKLGKLPFPRHCINSVIEYVTFWVWLLSLTIMYLRFMSVIADNKGLFFSLCYRMDIPHNLSIHSPAEGLSRCFKLLAVVNKTAKIFAYQFCVYANFISQMINDAEHFFVFNLPFLWLWWSVCWNSLSIFIGLLYSCWALRVLYVEYKSLVTYVTCRSFLIVFGLLFFHLTVSSKEQNIIL